MAKGVNMPSSDFTEKAIRLRVVSLVTGRPHQNQTLHRRSNRSQHLRSRHTIPVVHNITSEAFFTLERNFTPGHNTTLEHSSTLGRLHLAKHTFRSALNAKIAL